MAQTVLLYGSEIWVMTGTVLKVMEGLGITIITDRQAEDRELQYPPVADVMESTGLWTIK